MLLQPRSGSIEHASFRSHASIYLAGSQMNMLLTCLHMSLSVGFGIFAPTSHVYGVIILSFGNVFRLDLYFLNFFNFYSSTEIDHDPYVLYVHMTYVYSLFLCLSFHMITWPREVIIILWSFTWLWSSILWTHPHPHFPFPPLSHHPYTHPQCPPATGLSIRVRDWDLQYAKEEDNTSTPEDLPVTRLSTAKVKWDLPSNPSVLQAASYCWEPSLD